MAPLLIIGSGLMLLATILHIVGMATTQWVTFPSGFMLTEAGIFKACLRSVCGDLTANSTLNAVRAFCIIGCLLAFAVLAIILLFLLIKSVKDIKLVPIGMLLGGLGACGSILLGVIIFAADTGSADYGYSFALCIVGGLGIGAGGVLAFLGARASASFSTT